jgi:outer membrane lipoprotein-sorting protein
MARAALLVACGVLLAAALGGCATTQDTAAKKQAESKRILEARKHKRQSKSHDHGSQKR